MKTLKSILFLLFMQTGLFLFAQDEVEVYHNQIIDSKIETVLLSTSLSVYNPMPLLTLGQVNGLHLSFDKLEAENEFYQYAYIHCDANWKPSTLQVTEYVEGDLMGELQEFEYSSNVFQTYVHYTLSFPKPTMKLTKSGNYIIKIFKNFDPEDVVLIRRFMVLESKSVIKGSARPATSPSSRFTKQEIDFVAAHKNYPIQNPFQNIKATIIQNNSWATAIYNLPPLFSNNEELNFNYEDKNLMDGGSEFRYFDIRSLRFLSSKSVQKYKDSLTNVVLKPDELQSHTTYFKAIDYNGKRVIQNNDGTNVIQDGDYAMVHFFLESDNKIQEGDVYLYGELTDWQIKEKYKMTYIPDKKAYYLMSKLKQSYYNYHFVTATSSGPEVKVQYIYTEGNHSETENDYTILLYQHDVFVGYDRLIGATQLNSTDKRQ